MKHGKILKDKKFALGLKFLRGRIKRADIPSSSLDESLNIATWNIRKFGSGGRSAASLHYIAEILHQFDLIALTELRDNLGELKKVMDILGPYWKVVFSDYIKDRGGLSERIAYLYDKRMVSFTGLAAEADGFRVKNNAGEYLPEASWWRKPYMASFRAGTFDFMLLTVHIRWAGDEDNRVAPLELLAKWVDKRRKEKYVVDRDIILMGDFNIPTNGDKLYRAITRKGLSMPPALLKLKGSNLKQDSHYDQILCVPRLKSLFKKSDGGVIDFYNKSSKNLFPGRRMTLSKYTHQISDHLPLWVSISTDDEDHDLDQVLKPKKKGN